MTTKVKAKNASITIPEGFFDIWNVMKLKRRTGYEGLCALFRLMLWAEKECPDGRLTSMDGEDIEIYADWRGEDGKFFNALYSLGWIDDADGTYTLRTLDGYVRKEVQR